MVPSVLVVPAVLKGPDFHLDAHIYEKDGGVTGSLYRGSEKLTIRLEGDMTRPFFFAVFSANTRERTLDRVSRSSGVSQREMKKEMKKEDRWP